MFERYEDAHFYILLDCSASMGAGQPSKFHRARQVAAALGYLALSRLDRLGVAAFADGLAAELPPLRHKSRFARLLRFLDELALETRADRFCPLGCGLCRPPAPLVARWWSSATSTTPAASSLGWKSSAIMAMSRGWCRYRLCSEMEPRLAGDVELFDVETQAVRRVTITERMTQRYWRLLLSCRFPCSRIAEVTAYPSCISPSHVDGANPPRSDRRKNCLFTI